jgi:ribose/xylose/arabinose/galactoside ABC-type transport system permease subunit
MRLARELLSVFVVLILAYLVLLNYTGFSKDIGALGNFTTSAAKTFQGR